MYTYDLQSVRERDLKRDIHSIVVLEFPWVSESKSEVLKEISS